LFVTLIRGAAVLDKCVLTDETTMTVEMFNGNHKMAPLHSSSAQLGVARLTDSYGILRRRNLSSFQRTFIAEYVAAVSTVVLYTGTHTSSDKLRKYLKTYIFSLSV